MVHYRAELEGRRQSLLSLVLRFCKDLRFNFISKFCLYRDFSTSTLLMKDFGPILVYFLLLVTQFHKLDALFKKEIYFSSWL